MTITSIHVVILESYSSLEKYQWWVKCKKQINSDSEKKTINLSTFEDIRRRRYWSDVTDFDTIYCHCHIYSLQSRIDFNSHPFRMQIDDTNPIVVAIFVIRVGFSHVYSNYALRIKETIDYYLNDITFSTEAWVQFPDE